ncbi:MAG TPA: hypothetical protein PKD98_25970 [Anaerolineae bacterium]|nr:hypothetical protein [Anaerolineae bacterium]
MKLAELKYSRWVSGLAIFAALFGLLTVVSGGSVLFNAAAQRAAGNTVGFVLWFNFLAGFVYVIAAVGLWRRQRWSRWLAFIIATASLIIFAIFGLHILTGGGYEIRTVAAMSLRTTLWFIIAAVAYRHVRPTR